MWKWQNEWAYIKAAIDEFESFLFSNEIYWLISIEKSDQVSSNFQPRLSAGRLNVAVFLLTFFSERDAKIDQLVSPSLEKVNFLQEKWKSNWIKKSSLEFSVRLRQWESYLNEMRKRSISQAEYNNQIEVRLILGLLSNDASNQQDQLSSVSLESVDRMLKLVTSSGKFVWEESIEAAFPQVRFWYLYRNIA